MAEGQPDPWDQPDLPAPWDHGDAPAYRDQPVPQAPWGRRDMSDQPGLLGQWGRGDLTEPQALLDLRDHRAYRVLPD